MARKVFVSGCFDLLHSGHIAFLQSAATYGDLYVALGSDATVFGLKGRMPVNSQDERLYLMRSVACVKEAFISTGSGLLDFENELRSIRPDVFVVNADGGTPQKEALCQELGIEYVVLERTPHGDLPGRSTTALRRIEQMPYRLDLAGGWLDQPMVSKLHPGPVLMISLEPTIAFNERSGMATSTRNSALDLWGPKLPAGDPIKLAKILFAYDNPPGTEMIAGSQDSIGIAVPGLSRADYEGAYWPVRISRRGDEHLLRFIEESLYLVPLGERAADYNPLEGTNLTVEGAQELAAATNACWEAIHREDRPAMGAAMRASFEAQVSLFPRMMNPVVAEMIARCRDQAFGWKLSGAGGGGYLVLVSDQPIQHAIRLTIRREIS